MNFDYISGFFDADGSITLSRNSGKENRAVYIHLSNNEQCILEEIRLFFLENKIKSYIVTKKSDNPKHATNYSLTIQRNNAIRLCKLLTSKHSKKIHRINCINKYWNDVTNRNGKYNKQQIHKKQAFERLFFMKR